MSARWTNLTTVHCTCAGLLSCCKPKPVVTAPFMATDTIVAFLRLYIYKNITTNGLS